MGSSSKSGGSSNQTYDYYGHCAGVICQGQLDFITGILINNNLAWPDAEDWNANIYQPSTQFIYTDGNVYQTPIETNINPNGAPWVLAATPWTAGTYHSGDQKLYLGNVWKAVATTSSVPPSTAPVVLPIGVQAPTVVNGWIFISTPFVFVGGGEFWPINSIVAYKGQIYITSADTNAEPPDAPWSLWRLTRADNPANPLKITVTNFGDCYLYWGTPDQVLDTVDEQLLSQLGFPPMRNKVVLMLKNFLFGQGQQSPPDIQVLGGRNAVQSLITGASANLDDDWQANPWCVLAELLTHPVIGLGLPASYFNQAAWQAEADHCAANPSLFYISPIYTSLQKAREIVADLMSYPDAFIFWTAVGNLSAGHWPHGEAAPAFNKSNTVERDDLTEEINYDTNLWGDTFNGAQISFQDVQSGFKDRPIFANNLFNAKALRRMQSQQIDRPHIVRSEQAQAWGAEIAKISGDQELEGQALTIRAERSTAIVPGSLFLLTDDVAMFSQVQRCTARTVSAQPDGTIKLAHQTERGVAPEVYQPTNSGNLPQVGPPPTRVSSFAVVQLPSAISPAAGIAALAGRTNDVTTALDVYFKTAGVTAFQFLGTNKIFAVPGTLDVDINTDDNASGTHSSTTVNIGAVTVNNSYALGDTSFWQNVVIFSSSPTMSSPTTATEGIDYSMDTVGGNITILAGAITTGKYVQVQFWNAVAIIYDPTSPQADLDQVITTPTLDEVNDGQILLFAFKSTDLSIFEIMSVRSVQAVGVGTQGKLTWFVKVVRAFFGSTFGGDGTHVWGSDPNDVIFIIQKSGLVVLQHESFLALQDNGGSIDMRLVPSSAWVNADINDVYDVANNPAGLTSELVYNWVDAYVPFGSFGVTNVNGAPITDFTAFFATTDIFTFTFELDDPNGDLIHAAMIGSQGQNEFTFWSSNFSPTKKSSKTVSFSLPTGSWAVTLRLLDSAGNQVSVPLLSTGSVVVLNVGGLTLPPIITAPYPKKYGSSGRSWFFGPYSDADAADITIFFNLTARNAAQPVTWFTCGKWNAGGGNNYYGQPAGGASSILIIPDNVQNVTIWAYASRAGFADSAVLFWNF